jgi:uncharacterized protein DUF6249
MNDATAENIVPVVFIVVVFGLPLTMAIVNRVFAHHERMEMLKRGIVPPPDPKWAKRMGKAAWYDPGVYGMGQPQPGVAPPPYDAYAAYQASCNNPNRMLRKGITLAMIGFALLIGLSFIRPGMPGPWLLGGLIPLFVGVAQIIIAVISGASLGPVGINSQWQQPGVPPPGAAQQPSGQQPFAGPRDVTPGGYGGWRPGATTGLEKPPSPPDVR